MVNYAIGEGVEEALAAFSLPQTLGFGLVPTPVMYSVIYRDGQWGRAELLPYGPIEIMPGARALHSAEQVFEGMKAYRIGRDRAGLHGRPLARFADAAEHRRAFGHEHLRGRRWRTAYAEAD
jgi:hypothetical protein